MKNIKKLGLEILGRGEVKDIHFFQIKCSEFAYIYKCFNTNTYFEVFERKNAPVCIDFEKRIYSETEFKDMYPKANAFGVWAWTLPDIESAQKKAIEIEINVQKRLKS